MKKFPWKAAAVLATATVMVGAGIAQSKRAEAGSDRQRLIGTWHLVGINSPVPNGGPQPPLPIGLFIYTADGHEAVQLMYPKAAGSLNNEFVHDGYEASYGTYELDESKHLLKHHVIAANTGDKLVGTEELRMYSFPDAKHLVIRPVDPGQHWSVNWEKY